MNVFRVELLVQARGPTPCGNAYEIYKSHDFKFDL